MPELADNKSLSARCALLGTVNIPKNCKFAVEMKLQFSLLWMFFWVTSGIAPGTARACDNHRDPDHSDSFHHKHHYASSHGENICSSGSLSFSENRNNSAEESHHCHCPDCNKNFGGAYPGGLPVSTRSVVPSSPCWYRLKSCLFYYSCFLPEGIHVTVWQPPRY